MSAGASNTRGNSPQSSCQGKQAFELRWQAERAARRQGGVKVFSCRYCGCWHLATAGRKLER